MQKFIVLIIVALLSSTVHGQKNNETNISIQINGGLLDGTFLSSPTKEKLVIIIAGSGPTDRNGNSPMGVKANSYKLLAEEMNNANIASIRYDKRGIGKSKLKEMDEAKMSFQDFIDDAIVVFNYAKDSLGYKQIYFAGHSEGSLIGMVASQKTSAKGYISISGAAQPIDEIIMEQVNAQPEAVQEQVKDILKSLKEGNAVDDVPQYLLSLFRESIQPYMISWIKYNPSVEIKKLTVPILIVQGTCDVQVKKEQANKLHEANAKSQLAILQNMTHTLKDTAVDCNDAAMKTYSDSSLPLNKELIKTIIAFINQ